MNPREQAIQLENPRVLSRYRDSDPEFNSLVDMIIEVVRRQPPEIRKIDIPIVIPKKFQSYEQYTVGGKNIIKVDCNLVYDLNRIIIHGRNGPIDIININEKDHTATIVYDRDILKTWVEEYNSRFKSRRERK